MTATTTASDISSVVNALYFSTKTLHAEAERSGIIRELLRGQAGRTDYILLQRNLLPAYQALECGLERHRDKAALAGLTAYRLDRAPALEADLNALCHGDFSAVPLLPAGKAYADRIAACAEGDGGRLIAHAYTRYLGDLSGGQILKRLLATAPGLQPPELSFYDFPAYPDLDALKSDYRNAIDRAGSLADSPQRIVDEGGVAFTLNIELSCAVKLARLPLAPTVS
jgi:heme oxygenase